MAVGRTFIQMFKDRFAKKGLYDSPRYWDMKAEAYEGLARSNWPSNTYNRHWDARQMDLVDRALGDVRDLDVADVACGTGRASRHLAARGARVVGLDFAPRTLEAARREAAAEGLTIDFRAHNVLSPPPSDLVEHFDVVVTISCLAMACSTGDQFDLAVRHLVSMLRSEGRLLLLEPIHSSRLLRRILAMSAPEWIARCEKQGLVLIGRGRMGFVPVRLALAFRDLPDALVRPLFDAGERLIDAAKSLDRLSDYKWLLFRRGFGHDV
jgi:2-polyprenyl-3-methyl-5-hydroxy-6-metoxy-1,4-benzoquinol methylase